ncbi:MAG TPA: PEP-CTERM sorting domain-containing protein [Burkholderiales bacterium]|nr:PEP-CTERM sorting domain-containing protein [Burkholderiales bacterium]
MSCAARPRRRSAARGEASFRQYLGASPFIALLLGLAAGPAGAGVIQTGDVAVVPFGGGIVHLRVGDTSTGSLTVDSASALDGSVGLPPGPTPFNSVMIGLSATGDGTVNVTGAGSSLTANTLAAGQLGVAVGISGNGALNVTAGGSVTTNRFDAGCPTVFVPQTCGGTGTVKVDGSGSTINAGAVFNVGVSGSASASLTNGGVVNAQQSTIGSLNGSNGKVTVSGAGSQINLATGASPAFGRAFLNLGREQKGELDILAGGKVVLDAAPVASNITGVNIGGGSGLITDGGSFANGNGTIEIDGAGSELRIKQSSPFTSIGLQGKAQVDITNGGKLVVENNAVGSNAYVGRMAGGSGTVNVSGAGSEWQAGRRLYIGSNSDPANGNPTPGGTGTVNISNGAKLTVTGPNPNAIYIAAGSKLTGGGGTVVGNITSDGTIAPGNSPGIMNVYGNVTLNSGGNVQIELGGTNIALAQYDQLNVFDNPSPNAAGLNPVEGNLTVNGTVKVTLYGGYNPFGGSFFDVFTAIDVIEGSPVYDLPTLSGRHWEHSVIGTGNGREALRLTVVQDQVVPEPGSVALLAFGLAAIRAVRGRASS